MYKIYKTKLAQSHKSQYVHDWDIQLYCEHISCLLCGLYKSY